jgi:hypothetical protein
MQPDRTNLAPVEILIGATSIPILMKVTPARNGCDVFLEHQIGYAPIPVQEQKSIDTLLVEETLRSVQGMKASSTDMRKATAFFLIEVQEMYLFLVQMTGYRVGQVLVDKFNQLAAIHNAGVRIIDGRVVLTDELDTKVMFSLLQLTLGTVQGLTSAEATSKVVKRLNEKMPEGILRSAQNAGLAL